MKGDTAKFASVTSGHAYLTVAIVSGAIVITAALRTLIATPPDVSWYVLVALTVIGAWLTLRMPDIPASFSISDAFTFTIALLFGPSAAVVAVAIDAAVISTRLMRSDRLFTRIAFNVSGASLAMLVSARTFFLLSGTAPSLSGATSITNHLGALAVFAGLYFVSNTGLIAIAIALDQHRQVWRVWREHFLPLWQSSFAGAAAAALTVLLVRVGDMRVFALIAAIPFLTYAGFKTAIGRMDDHLTHLNRVNSMHLATIETLAQAIDARDQVTHDHIRRVQKYAMRLARELGVVDDRELRALEAASLLHDMGKLAIPEHILNKPDRLTPAEFERMKMHAAIGADILSSIEFPFPIVPIVRHHHENWDGSGYPAGLKETDIPIGARILSVVDCFDALTSDRPYRPALSMAEALQVILARRGIMYDPDVVAAFVRLKDEFSSELQSPSPGHVLGVMRQARGAPAETPTYRHGVTREFVATVAEIGSITGAHPTDLALVCSEIRAKLMALLGELTLVIYQYDQKLDALFVRQACGPYADSIRELTIGLGLRLSGWVAANRRTIVNSEAALDLGNIATKLLPTPQLCASTHMTIGPDLIGAITIYSPSVRALAPAEGVLLETIAALLARIVRQSQSAGLPLSEDATSSCNPVDRPRRCG
jgi:putative nucleotidyltransferase with HDIG domain